MFGNVALGPTPKKKRTISSNTKNKGPIVAFGNATIGPAQKIK